MTWPIPGTVYVTHPIPNHELSKLSPNSRANHPKKRDLNQSWGRKATEEALMESLAEEEQEESDPGEMAG